MDEKKLPPPYPRMAHSKPSPFTLRCDEIDDAAELIHDPDAFAEAAKGDRVLSEGDTSCYCFLEKPDGPYIRHFTEEAGCPAFKGVLNAGSTSNVLCGLTDVQLHIYCSLKFCEKGRRVYCPIWQAKGKEHEEDTDHSGGSGAAAPAGGVGGDVDG